MFDIRTRSGEPARRRGAGSRRRDRNGEDRSMTGQTIPAEAAPDDRDWPEGLTRIPYWLFQRDDVYRDEQKRIFQGPVWNYLCLEGDVAAPGQYRVSSVGDASVIVAR